MIKRVVLLLLAVALLAGCGPMVQKSEFWQHPTWYTTCDHMCYSWTKFKNTTPEHYQQGQAEGWWGIDTPVNK